MGNPGSPTDTIDPPLTSERSSRASQAAGVRGDVGAWAPPALPVDWGVDPRPVRIDGSAWESEPRRNASGPASTSFGRRFWRDLAIGALAVLMVHIFLVQISVVRGLSMAPSLQDGDRLMVDRVSYAMSDVSRFDVVVLRYPRNPDVDFVKRVIGLPGDVVGLADGVLSVNGVAVEEDFAHVSDVYAAGSWRVPNGQYFVLGDNRPVSCDSREFGMVSHDLLKGKVRVRFWPLSRLALF